MANLMDYLDWRGDLTLEISPFNEVDALILAELSFVDFDGIVPPPELGRGLPLCEAAEAFFARHGGKDVPMGVLVPDTISKMLRKLMTSPRFRNMTLNGYTALLDDSIEQQFAALTIDLGNGSIYISFRGTDDTIVGWKEDLNMGFLEEIPSQKQAVEYVARVARQYSDKTIREAEKAMKDGEAAGYSYWKMAVSMKAAILTAEKKREEAVALYEEIAGKAVERKDPYYVMEGYRMCGFLRYEEGKLEQAFEYFLLALAGGSYLSEDIRRSSTFTYAAHLALHTGRQVRAPIDIEVLEHQLHEWLGEDWKELVENPSMRQAKARRKGGIFN